MFEFTTTTTTTIYLKITLIMITIMATKVITTTIIIIITPCPSTCQVPWLAETCCAPSVHGRLTQPTPSLASTPNVTARALDFLHNLRFFSASIFARVWYSLLKCILEPHHICERSTLQPVVSGAYTADPTAPLNTGFSLVTSLRFVQAAPAGFLTQTQLDFFELQAASVAS